MRRTMCTLALALLIAAPGIAYAKIKPWQPPEGMVWHTPDRKCNANNLYGPFIQACYFGRADRPEHAGLAFFRKCGKARQMMPFIVADFEKNEFKFNPDPSKEDAELVTGKLNAAGDIDPDPYLVQLPPVEGVPCFPKLTMTGEPV